jgi:hypothetical protein
MATFNSANNSLFTPSKTLFEMQMLNNESVYSADWRYQVARNKIPNVSLVNVYGYQPVVSSTFIPLWENATTYTYPVSATQMLLYSSSASDTNVSVVINGLDTNFASLSETLVLTNGTTGVPTVNSYLRINSISITGTVNAVGTLVLGNAGKTIIYAQINAGVSKSQMSMYNVPTGYTFFLNRVSVAAEGASNGKTLNYRSYTINANGITGHVLTSPFATNYETIREVPNPYPAGTSIQWQCQSSSQTLAIGLRVEGVLISNSLG